MRGGETVTEERDRREINLHEVFSLRVQSSRLCKRLSRKMGCSKKVGDSCMVRFRRDCIWTC